MANVAKLALEMENRAIVMSRAELEKLAQSGTVAGEKIKAALAGVTPIAQTVADRAAQARAQFTQFEQSQTHVNSVTAAILRMRAAVEQVRANAMASQVALNDPFQKAEQSINRVTAAIERMRAANRQSQANAMAGQISALDPFQGASGAGAERANANMRAFTLLTREAANASGLLGRQGFMVANALSMAAERFGEMRAAALAANAATGATTSVFATLGATLKSINPLVLAAVAGFAAYAITTKLLGDNTDELVEAAERNIQKQEKLTELLREQNKVWRENAERLEDARARLAAVQSGGEAGLDRMTARLQNLRAAMEFGSRMGLAGKDADVEAAKMFKVLEEIRTTNAATDAALAHQGALRGEKERLEELRAALTGGATAVEALRRARLFNQKAPGLVTEQEVRNLQAVVDNLERMKRASAPIENLPAARAPLQPITTAIEELPEAIQTVRAELDETFGQRLGRYAVNFSALADELIGAFSGAADAIRGELQGVFGAGAFGTLLGNVAGAGVGSLFSGLFEGLFGGSGPSAREQLRAELDAWNQEFDRFIRDLQHHRDPLQQALDDIEDWYNDQLDAIQRLLDRAQAQAAASRSPGFRLGGMGGFDPQSRDFWDRIASRDQTVVDELVRQQEELNAEYERQIQLAKEAAEAERQRTVLSLQAELARAKGNDALATQIERQLRLDGVTDKQQTQLLKQIFAAEDAARAMEKLTDNIDDLRNVMQSLQAFEDSLKLSNLSPLSPIQQLAESRRQFEAMAALALAGDRTAAQSLSGSGSAFLEASRGVNASSAGFVADFNRVQAIIDQVQGRFAGELSTEEAALNELKLQTKDFRAAFDRAEGQRDNQIAVMAAVGQEVITMRNELREALDALRSTVAQNGDAAFER